VRGVGAQRIDRDGPARRIDQQVHVLHRHGAEQNFIAHNERAHVAEALAEAHLDRPHIRHACAPPVCHGHIACRLSFEIELRGDVRWYAQHQRAGIGERLHCDGPQVHSAWIAELDFRKDMFHWRDSQSLEQR
jgi:hypothetical protein